MSVTELRVTGIRAIRYRMPLKRAYGTARGVTSASVNFLVALSARAGAETVQGIGECQPRHMLTGDGPKDRLSAWAFVCAALRQLEGRTIRFTGREDAVDAVRAVMTDLNELAGRHADDSNGDRPFRGTLLGLEVAVLDIVSRALGLQISELLGKQRDEISISISTISSSTDLNQVWEKVTRQTRFPMTRVKGLGDIAHDLQLLDLVTRANRSVDREKPLWIDINEAMDYRAAADLVHRLAERMGAGQLPGSLVLEGVLPKPQVDQLPQLQRLADERCRASTADRLLDLRIMPDEGLWDAGDLARLNTLGGCRAINIKAPKAGGLLASLDLANAAVAADPAVHICVGGMVGTSDVTAWALHNLARALPRVDYLTTVPPRNVAARITAPLANYVTRGSNIISPQAEPGLGTRILAHKVAPYVEATFEQFDDGIHVAKPTASSWRASATASRSVRTLVFAGDTSLGDVYVQRRGGSLQNRIERDPMSFFAGLKPVVAGHDAFILNLETVLADSPSSPFEGRKPFLGWDSPDRTIRCLQELGVSAAGLANNHTMDFGDRHLLETKEALERAGIRTFGAGESQVVASAPLTLAFDFYGSERRIHVIGAMQSQPQLRDEFRFYASGGRPGINRISRPRVAALIEGIRREEPSSLIVVFPHWGRNYQWVSEGQQRTAEVFRQAGADLIIGHGSHMLQQCSFADNNAVVYSLGNFMFNWGGRFGALDAPPFGLVARVEVAPERDAWKVDLRLYPLVVDNRVTDHQPRLVDDAEFDIVWSTLSKMDVDRSFAGHAQAATDTTGRHILHSFTTDRFTTDRRPPAARPATQAGTRTSTGAASSNVYDDAESARLLGLLNRRLLGSLLIAREAERGGARVEWLSSDTFLASTPASRLLFAGNRCTETVAVSRTVKDKALLKEMLAARSVGVAAGGAASTYEEALRIMQGLAGPAVVKPRRGDRGAGVTVGVSSPAELRLAYDHASADGGVLVEEMVAGREFRCLATPDECIGVYSKDPPHVQGDGRHTIRELIEKRNRYRAANPALAKKPIAFDEHLARHLQNAGLTLQSVPESGAAIPLGSIANTYQGGEVTECTDTAPAVVKEAAIAAVGAVPGLKWAGVDLILEDAGSAAEGPARVAVLEVNVNAGIANFHFPSFGRARNVARRLWETRVAAATPEPEEGATQAPRRSGQSVRLADATDSEGEATGQVELPARFIRHLRSSGYRVKEVGHHLVLASRAPTTKLVYGCASDGDLSVTARIMNRQALLRKVLRRSGVPIPDGRNASSPAEIEEFLDQCGSPVAVLPARGEGTRGRTAVVSPDSGHADLTAALEEVGRGRSVFVQQWRPGTRLLVLTTRSRGGLAIISSSEDAIALADKQVAGAARLATEAVRAVPELRWAAVSVLIPHGTGSSTATESAVVERMTLRPEIAGSQFLVAGRLSDFFAAIATAETRPRQLARAVVGGKARRWRHQARRLLAGRRLRFVRLAAGRTLGRGRRR
jgi:D-alanine-D-alanine ligase-like ATP-grasp enzyme/L-alanine-DL-glutamate epimerase-like enolase superfamily enzyme